ncbi:MAG TPA: Spy/CpxP family protein refolding chaperone [Candidatus Baltobacteraceae bacterium]|jgi:Spy/CpxP family protein refolding chaperone|nr:Spy/CpxP family protein refolding chaperone [Candidatus Baltobacteraceae bacterium]
MKISPILLSGALALAVALPVAGFAQQTPAQPPAGAPAAGHHHNHGMRMFRGLNLSDQQKAQLQQIRDQYRQSHPEGSAPDRASRKAMHDQMMNVLTPAQQAQLKTNMAQMREHRPAGTGPNGTFAPEPSPTSSP